MSNATTYDGLPIAEEPPLGASIIVYREKQGRIEFLLLHRAHSGPGFEGEWAWTPPAGARQPGEEVQECAKRELMEEAGLELRLELTDLGNEKWQVYSAKLESECDVLLGQEHDRFEWVGIDQVSRCKPDFVAQHIFTFYEGLRA